MLHQDLYVAKRTMNQRVEEELRTAEVRRMWREVRRTRPRGWSRGVRLLVCELGYLLVAFGAWLERYALPPVRQLEAEANGGS